MRHKISKHTPGNTGNRKALVSTIIEVTTRRKLDELMYCKVQHLYSFANELQPNWDAIKSAMSDKVIDDHDETLR